ncbi:MAG: EbsA family protein [Liquorilactobacillus hordei]|nr:EbsA family protein [Liquorilactobacillus hordei]
MNMNKKFWYQPDFATSVICWSFTFMILLLSVLLWLEITVFQIWTVIVFLIFCAITIIQLLLRWIEVGDEQMIVHTIIPQNTKKITLTNIENVRISKYGIIITVKRQKYHFIMSKSNCKILYNIIVSQ